MQGAVLSIVGRCSVVDGVVAAMFGPLRGLAMRVLVALVVSLLKPRQVGPGVAGDTAELEDLGVGVLLVRRFLPVSTSSTPSVGSRQPTPTQGR